MNYYEITCGRGSLGVFRGSKSALKTYLRLLNDDVANWGTHSAKQLSSADNRGYINLLDEIAEIKALIN